MNLELRKNIIETLKQAADQNENLGRIGCACIFKGGVNDGEIAILNWGDSWREAWEKCTMTLDYLTVDIVFIENKKLKHKGWV